MQVVAFNDEKSVIANAVFEVAADSALEAAQHVLQQLTDQTHAFVGQRAFRRRSNGQVIEL